MKTYWAISLVVIFICGAFYVNDRKDEEQKNLHFADSLDKINSFQLHYSVDSLMHMSDKDFNRKIFQLKRQIDFQQRVILRFKMRLDSLIKSERGR